MNLRNTAKERATDAHLLIKNKELHKMTKTKAQTKK